MIKHLKSSKSMSNVLEMLMVIEMVKKYPIFHGIQRYTTTFTVAY